MKRSARSRKPSISRLVAGSADTARRIGACARAEGDNRTAYTGARHHARGARRARRRDGRGRARLLPAHDGGPDDQRARRPDGRPRFRVGARADRAGGLGLAAHRGGRGERPVASARVPDGAAARRALARRRAHARHLARHLPVRVRRAAHALRLRLGAAVSPRGAAAPVQRDEELELTIDSLAYGGNGVARLDGFVVFVRRGLPGDTVRARVTKVQRRHAEALATEVVAAGPQRVDAPCAHYPACGGCRFQDLAYDAQLAAKEQWVADSLQRLARLADPPLEPIVPAASHFGYRNKMEYSFTPLEDGPTLGLHKAGRWDEVLEIERCWLTTDVGNAIRNRVRDWAREEKLPAYDQETQEGYLRHLVVREGRNTVQALVQLVTARGERFDRERLIEVLTDIPEVRSIHWSVNRGVAEVTNLPTELLWGEDAIEEEIGGLRLRVRPNAFLQTNTEMAERLYELALEFAALDGGETVYDLYCGIGTIGLSAAARALTVWGIEISEESVACAIENAELNSVGNAAFFAGNVGEVLEELRARAGDPDVVIVDPPRAGLAGKALKRLGEIGAPRVVYVSCNPTTLAGDAKRLADGYGYRLLRARPVDMFPHTPHVECVSLL